MATLATRVFIADNAGTVHIGFDYHDDIAYHIPEPLDYNPCTTCGDREAVGCEGCAFPVSSKMDFFNHAHGFKVGF
jgi:hypothetical protein